MNFTNIRPFTSLLFFLILSTSFCYSKDLNYIYDARGNVMSFNNNHLLSLTEENGYKIYYKKQNDYNSSKKYSTTKPKKAKGKKRWYEVDWNQGVKLCPEKNFNSGNGAWIVNSSAHIDSTNCVYVDGSPYTRSILVLYSRDLSDLTEADSNWILVNQTIVDLRKKTHCLWIEKLIKTQPLEKTCQEKSFDYDLIVDKTEFTIGEAEFSKKNYCKKKNCSKNIQLIYYPTNSREQLLYYPISISSAVEILDYARWRSIQDGLSIAYPKMNIDSITNGYILFESQSQKMKTILDTTSDGYRIPTYDEWVALQLAGQHEPYFWGNEEDKFKQFAWDLSTPDNGFVHQTKQLAPNPFGLFDVYGNADEMVTNLTNKKANIVGECMDFSIHYLQSPACLLQKRIRSSRKTSKKAICIDNECTPYIHRGMWGFRLVRKLE